MDEEKYLEIQNDGTIYKIRDLIDEFDYNFILYKIFTSNEEIRIKHNFMLINLMPIYVRILYILRVIDSWYYNLSLHMSVHKDNPIWTDNKIIEMNRKNFDNDFWMQIEDMDTCMGLLMK